MTAYTLIANTNVDALVGRAGGDTIGTNGFNIVMDEHTRYGLNAATNATWAAITSSATLGGDILIDGRLVRMVYYTGGSGNVPAYNTVISKGGASGLLIGVYDTLTVAPTTPGSAMPANGYILIKQWNSVAYSAGALTGITASVDVDPITGLATDRAGWIEIVGTEATFLTLNGLNNQSNKVVRGNRFTLGKTPGTPARTDTYQIPSNGNNAFAPGVFVENTPGGFATGDYEFWAATTDTATIDKVGTDIYRGKYCWIDSTGLVRFGHDGTNFTGGRLPNANCEVAIGNVILNSASAAARTVNTLSATVGNRYTFSTGGLASLELEWVTCNWRISITTAKRCNLESVGLTAPFSATQMGEKMYWNNSGIGAPVDNSAVIMADFVTSTFGLEADNCTFGRGKASAVSVAFLRFNASDNIKFTNSRITLTGDRPNTSAVAFSFISASNIELANNVIAGNVACGQGVNYWLHHNKYYFSGGGIPALAPNAINCWSVPTVVDCLIEDEEFPLTGVGEYQVPGSGLISISANSRNVTLRNVGSYSSPINGRGYTENDVAWSRVAGGTVATVTTTAPHLLRVGDTVVVWRVDQPGTITRTVKTITTVPTSTTFTFTCVNSGPLLGTLSFYTGHFTVPINIAGNNVSGVKIQNVWVLGHSAQPFTLNATMADVDFENVGFDPLYVSAPTVGGTNFKQKSVFAGTTRLANGSALLGTHFADTFTNVTTIAGKTGVSTTRVGGTVTAVATNHGLYTNDYIQIYNSSYPTGAVEGLRQVTVIDKDTFTFAGANSGSLSGTVSYHVATARLDIFMNDPSPDTTAQVQILSGTPRFAGNGTLASFNIGDSILWEHPDFLLGFDNFAPFFPDITGSTNVIQHYNVFYDLDRGSGFAGYKNFYYQRPGGSGSNGGSTLNMTSTAGVQVGDFVRVLTGGGITEGAYVTNINSGVQVQISIPNSAAVSGVLIFSHTQNETAFPSTGVKMRIKTETFGAPTTATTGIMIPMKSTVTSRQRLYPQAVDTVTFTLAGLPSGSTVALYDNTDTLLLREDNITSGEFIYDYIHSGVDFTDNYYVVWHEDYEVYKSALFDLTAIDLGLSFTPIVDTIYDAGYDDRYTIDFVNKRIIMKTGETQYDVAGAYSKWKDEIFLLDNFIYDFAFITEGGVTYSAPRSIPDFTGLINSWKIRPDEANHVLTVENGILYVDGGGDPFVNTLGAYTVRIPYSAPIDVLTISTGSGVLPTDISDIASAVQTQLNDDFDAIPTAAENATAVQAELVDEFLAIDTELGAIADEQKLPNLLIKDRLS